MIPNTQPQWKAGICWFYILMLIVGMGVSALQQQVAPLSSMRSARRPLGLDVSSCPVLEFARPSNDTVFAESTEATGTFTLPTAEEQLPKEQETARTPKLLGWWSQYGFLLASLRGKPHKYLARLQRKHGPNFIVRPNMVVLNDPKAIRDVLETHNLPKTPKVRYGYKSIFYGTNSRSSGGILAAPWKKWLEQRRMAAPALAESVIGSLAPKFYHVSKPMLEHLEAMAQRKQPVDMSMAFNAVTMDIIGNILLGKSFGMCQQLNLEGRKVEVPFATALHRLTGRCSFVEVEVLCYTRLDILIF